MSSTATQRAKLFVHENSYKRGLVSKIHQNRLAVLQELFLRYVPESAKSWADFGCSNGFIIERFLQSGHFEFQTVCGYDHVRELLEIAARKVPSGTFHHIDLNTEHPFQENQFSVVSCFETLEHVGNYPNALETLVNATETDGLIFISVPNEVGLPGIIKYTGRSLLRRNAYGDFFDEKSPWCYLRDLVLDKPISSYREPGRPGYGPHLGFDYRELRKYIQQSYLESGRLILLEEHFTRIRMNVTWVLKKAPEQ